jgi:hypothetical protein
MSNSKIKLFITGFSIIFCYASRAVWILAPFHWAIFSLDDFFAVPRHHKKAGKRPL